MRGDCLNGLRTERTGSVVGGTSRSGNSAQIIKTYFTIIALLISFTHTHTHRHTRSCIHNFFPVCMCVHSYYSFIYTYLYRHLRTAAARACVCRRLLLQWVYIYSYTERLVDFVYYCLSIKKLIVYVGTYRI